MTVEKCACYDVRQVYAYANNGRFCGSLDNATKLFNFEIRSCAEKAENSYKSCINGTDQDSCPEALFRALVECIEPYLSMLEDLICMEAVFEEWMMDRESLCDCSPPCYEMQYQFTTGIAIYRLIG